jgi:hypothetical protein
MITLDNASNCTAMMSDLARLLSEMGISFDYEGNRIRLVGILFHTEFLIYSESQVFPPRHQHCSQGRS